MVQHPIYPRTEAWSSRLFLSAAILAALFAFAILGVEARITKLKHLRDADRDITRIQLETLKTALAPLQGQKLDVSVIPGNTEAEQFATRLRTALLRCGLQASPSGDRPAWSPTPKGFGLSIGVTRQKDAEVLRDALSKAGLATEHIPSKGSGGRGGGGKEIDAGRGCGGVGGGAGIEEVGEGVDLCGGGCTVGGEGEAG